MQGKIIKGIAGFYYVHVIGKGTYECKAKGIFRNKKIKPLVGDYVVIEIISDAEFLGNIVDILPRNNSLIRPAVANIDQVLIIFALAKPNPNYVVLSRFILMMDLQGIDAVICFNKKDIADAEKIKEAADVYSKSGCPILFTSIYESCGIDRIRNILKGKTTALAGPSGVGKSSITNLLLPQANMRTGEVSEKIGRGRHTTRHSEIFHIEGSTYLFDTPGFTSFTVTDMEEKEIRSYFQEFAKYENQCRFQGCVHINEPGCAVKEAVSDGKINRIRYENYLEIYQELKEKRKY